MSYVQNAWDDENYDSVSVVFENNRGIHSNTNLSSVVSSTTKNTLKSVGPSYYSYLTSVEKQLRDEKEARHNLE